MILRWTVWFVTVLPFLCRLGHIVSRCGARMSSVLPFLKPGSTPRPTLPPADQIRLADLINDLQLLILERPHVFTTIARLVHGLADKARARLAREARRDRSTEQHSS